MSAKDRYSAHVAARLALCRSAALMNVGDEDHATFLQLDVGGYSIFVKGLMRALNKALLTSIAILAMRASILDCGRQSSRLL